MTHVVRWLPFRTVLLLTYMSWARDQPLLAQLVRVTANGIGPLP